jgi:uncharacterized protein YbaP (TraB family)
MIRHIGLLLGALWLSGCGAPSDSGFDQGRDWPSPSPAIWEATTPDGQTGWLFGTVHALPAGLDWRSDAFERAFVQSDLLVVEIANLGDGSAAQEAFRRLAHTPGLPPLSQRVEAADRPALENLLERADMEDDGFGDTESWAAALMLSSAVRTADPESGVDRALLAEGKRVAALESFDAQYRLFDGLSPDAQSALLAGIAEEAAETDRRDQVEFWLRGKTASLEPLLSGGFLQDAELREALLDRRNRAWADRIAEWIRAGERPFVAVGAGHMLGDEGLPRLLEAQGFDVRRIDGPQAGADGA